MSAAFEPVVPAVVEFGDDGVARAPAFGDVYHPRDGAFGQARHVFIAGNGLPGRWSGRPRFVVLETGFGLGNNFLATWQAWRDDPQRPERLVFVSVEKHPPRHEDLARAHRASPAPDLAAALLEAWPPLTPDLHLIDFDGGRVRLMLAFADITTALAELVLQADAFYLDGFAPARNPSMWAAPALKRLARLAAPGASVATWCLARELRDGLAAAGFEVGTAPGFGGRREMTVARFAPRHTPPPWPGRLPAKAQRVAVIGARLAGSSTARALAQAGLEVRVFDASPAATLQPSAEIGGLFHGIVHRHDGTHARWLRAAALQAQRVLGTAIAAGAVPGRLGLLRGEHAASLEAMQALIARQALPPDWVQAWDADTVRTRAAVPWTDPAWYYPGGGWVAPLALTAHWLASSARIQVQADCRIDALTRDDAGWRLLDGQGRTLDRADAVVLANASDAMRLLGAPAWPWHTSRGQISLLPGPWPALPFALADGGYTLKLPDGRVLAGATAQRDDLDATPREADHHENLATLQRLTGWDLPGQAPAQARVGWRMQVGDRLPLLGGVPDPAAPGADHARAIVRQPGLYIAAGFGSRGVTHAALAGELLAAGLTGAPMPLPAALLDAVDVARFAARLNRSAAS